MTDTTLTDVTQLIITPISSSAMRVILSQPSPPPPPTPIDFVVSNLGMSPAAPTAGTPTRFWSVITNQGTTDAPAGTVIGCRYDVDGAITSWSDTYSGGLLAGNSITLSANGGPNGDLWNAVAGSHAVVAWVDDVNRFPSETPKDNNFRTLSFSVGGTTSVTATVSTSVTFSGNSTIVGDLSSLQTALNRGDLDITLVQQVNTPNGGVNVPRIAGGRTLRCSSSGILVRGGSGNVLRSDGSGGRLTLSGFRVDGGWRSNPHEGEDSESNYNLEGYTFLRLENCVTCYSYRTGFFTPNTGQLEIVGCMIFCNPRDAVWDTGTYDYLFEGNEVRHCGDDSWGTHGGQGSIVRSIICRNNIFRDGFGLKGHHGSAIGTRNGKPGQVLIEGNTFEASGLYGFYFWHDIPNNEAWGPPRNIKIRNNTWRDTRSTTRSSGNQNIGVMLLWEFPEDGYDSSIEITGNTFVRNTAAQGQTLQSRYSWPVPANVPGASAFASAGFFSKNGFQSNETFQLASIGTRNDGGANFGAITHSGNTWTGSGWSNTLS